ncbi:MAG: ABC transporter ATP-binding protein, partial [Oscillospiraceae bacterium]|nr:ABC transporter ATP-binding protein [Oscillospiraceae bacterium]
MIKTMLKSLREFKKPTFLTLALMVAEVLIDVLIPFYTADLVNRVKAGVPMNEVLVPGLMLVVMALLSLVCGGAAGVTGSRASAGFARNLRADLFSRIQTFSFENIDRFSPPSLVTRLTTDIQYVMMAYMMSIRLAVRAPLMFLFSVIMAYIMGGRLAMTFVIVIPVLLFGLVLIARKAMPAFRAVFRKYDRMNESVEENVRAMRVVKG